jgi:hypothetical protein
MYSCDNCGNAWDTGYEAAACCPLASTVYPCPRCGCCWGEPGDAFGCCEQYRYQCEECESTYSERSDAVECCAEIHSLYYRCDQCDSCWATADAAAECCPDELEAAKGSVEFLENQLENTDRLLRDKQVSADSILQLLEYERKMAPKLEEQRDKVRELMEASEA